MNFEEYQAYVKELERAIVLDDTFDKLSGIKDMPNTEFTGKCLDLYCFALTPMSNLIATILKYCDAEEIDDASKKGIELPVLSAGEIFDIVIKVSTTPSFFAIIRRLANDDASVYDALIDAVSNQNRELFVDIIHENHCPIEKASRLCYYQKLICEPFEELQPSKIPPKHRLQVFDSFIRRVSGKLDTNPNKYNESNKAFSKLMAEFVACYLIPGSAEKKIFRIEEKAKKYFNEFIGYAKEIYSQTIYSIENQGIGIEDEYLSIIKSRPEVAEYFKVWDEECQNKQVEAVVSSDEERSAQHFEEALQGTQPSLKDAILSHLSNDDKETDKSLMIGDLSFYVNEKDKLADLFSGLVDIDVVPREDCQYVVYRFTGKWKPNELPECIKWKSDLNDLLYLVKKLIDGNGKYGRALQLFEIDGIPPKQPAAYAERPSIKLRKLFESIFGKS